MISNKNNVQRENFEKKIEEEGRAAA